MEPVTKTRLREPVLMMLGVALLIYWLINTMNTGNALWFLPFQPIFEPSRIVVRDYGTAVTIRPGDPGYVQLSEALNQTLSDFINTDLVPIGLSDETLRRYNEEELVVESFYADNIQFNTAVRMTGINQLLIPIDSTHADNRYVFMASNGLWRAGALVVKDDTPIKQALRDLGYLKDG